MVHPFIKPMQVRRIVNANPSANKYRQRPCYVKVGDYVYEAFQPQKPGKVVSIAHQVIHGAVGSFDEYNVTVKLVNGTTKVVQDLVLRDFNRLIADHQKKLNTHTSKLPLLAKL